MCFEVSVSSVYLHSHLWFFLTLNVPSDPMYLYFLNSLSNHVECIFSVCKGAPISCDKLYLYVSHKYIRPCTVLLYVYWIGTDLFHSVFPWIQEGRHSLHPYHDIPHHWDTLDSPYHSGDPISYWDNLKGENIFLIVWVCLCEMLDWVQFLHLPICFMCTLRVSSLHVWKWNVQCFILINSILSTCTSAHLTECRHAMINVKYTLYTPFKCMLTFHEFVL